MVEQTSASDFEDGVSGKGDKWQRNVDTDQAENKFTGGIDSESASELTSNAKDSSDDYRSNLAEAFGLDNVDSDVASEWEDGMDSDAESEWQSNTANASGKWREEVQNTSASEWEENASQASQDWFSETKDALDPNS